jgi:nuclear pore complex protein Nup160
MAAPASGSRRIAGTEVPITGSDKVRWIDLTVPYSLAAAPASPADPFVSVPPRAASGCHVVSSGGASQRYLAWCVTPPSPHCLVLYGAFLRHFCSVSPDGSVVLPGRRGAFS